MPRSGGETNGPILQENYPDYSQVAQHVVVKGFGSHDTPDPSVPA